MPLVYSTLNVDILNIDLTPYNDPEYKNHQGNYSVHDQNGRSSAPGGGNIPLLPPVEFGC